jgi:hypothetical protein
MTRDRLGDYDLENFQVAFATAFVEFFQGSGKTLELPVRIADEALNGFRGDTARMFR